MWKESRVKSRLGVWSHTCRPYRCPLSPGKVLQRGPFEKRRTCSQQLTDSKVTWMIFVAKLQSSELSIATLSLTDKRLEPRVEPKLGGRRTVVELRLNDVNRDSDDISA